MLLWPGKRRARPVHAGGLNVPIGFLGRVFIRAHGRVWIVVIYCFAIRIKNMNTVSAEQLYLVAVHLIAKGSPFNFEPAYEWVPNKHLLCGLKAVLASADQLVELINDVVHCVMKRKGLFQKSLCGFRLQAIPLLR